MAATNHRPPLLCVIVPQPRGTITHKTWTVAQSDSCATGHGAARTARVGANTERARRSRADRMLRRERPPQIGGAALPPNPLAATRAAWRRLSDSYPRPGRPRVRGGLARERRRVRPADAELRGSLSAQGPFAEVQRGPGRRHPCRTRIGPTGRYADRLATLDSPPAATFQQFFPDGGGSFDARHTDIRPTRSNSVTDGVARCRNHRRILPSRDTNAGIGSSARHAPRVRSPRESTHRAPSSAPHRTAVRDTPTELGIRVLGVRDRRS